VHPVAHLFPMMTDEELADLAADIKANGLIQPIVIDYKGLLIDGRNRAKACEIAGIKPAVRMFEGDDPRAFILSMNLKRRHMSAGQQAMAHAMIYPEPEKGGRGKKSKNSTETLGFSAMRLSQARTVLSHSRDVAMEILAGTKFLDKEYATARKRTVQSDAVRGKKVPVVTDNPGVQSERRVGLHYARLRHRHFVTRVFPVTNHKIRGQLEKLGAYDASGDRATVANEATAFPRLRRRRGIVQVLYRPLERSQQPTLGLSLGVLGRRSLSDHRDRRHEDLKHLVEPVTMGDPMRPLMWVSKSQW
jgi:hypothetical protein